MQRLGPQPIRFGVATVAVLLAAIPASEARVQQQASVTVIVHGAGVVQSEPAGIQCGTDCMLEVAVGTSVRLTATPDDPAAETFWDRGCVGRARVCTVVVEGSTFVDATFARTPELPDPVPLLVTTSIGGRVVGSPAGFIDCGFECTTAWPAGGDVMLTPLPDAGYVFESWVGSCTGTGLCLVSLSEPRSASALFRPLLTVVRSSVLTIVNRNPPPLPYASSSSGTVALMYLGTSTICDLPQCSYLVPDGVVVTLTRASGTVQGWEGACSGSADPCRFVMNGALGVTVAFRRCCAITSKSGINVARSGSGRVTSVPAGIDCGSPATCAAAFGTTTTVRLIAVPTPGWTFTGWAGDCGGSGTCLVRADAPRSVTAVFRMVRHTVRVVVRGRGSVTSTPDGISCPPECAYAFPEGQVVSLAARAEAGFRFAGWSGSCTGPACAVAATADADTTATFQRCATRDFRGFGPRALRSPRRIRISVSLTGPATVTATVLLRGRVTARRSFGRLPTGTQRLHVAVRRAGTYKVSLRVADLCGSKRTVTRMVTVR